jgi:hypothetical protein
MDDPLRDPRFPKRPQHPDFWRLSDAILEQDGRAEEGGEDVFTIADVDGDSIAYVAQQRAALLTRAYGVAVTRDVAVLLMSAYIDAFTLGRAFERKGGHREAEL